LESIFGFYTVDYQPNVLCGWIYGPKVSCMERMDDDTVINGCMFLFEKFLSKLMNFRRPINVQTTRWATNKHFLGTYSYHSITTDLLKTSSGDLALPIHNPLGRPCVLFAGEATHSDYFGTVHGAIESGYREAKRILTVNGLKC
jgi:spermine oxidase